MGMNVYRGRYAPSPTGEMHLGNAWTALLAWLHARSHDGRFVLRIEDLDPERSKPAYEAQLLADLQWLGLDWEEGTDKGGPFEPYRQSERFPYYHQLLAGFRQEGRLYACSCTRAQLSAGAPHPGEQGAAYLGTCREKQLPLDGHYALRIRTPHKSYGFTDERLGWIEQDVAAAVGDFVVQRADGVPAYQLAVTADDAAMQITHVVRGDDLLDSTPRQLFLYEMLGKTPPQFLHLPLLIDPEGRRLSKRQRDLSLAALRSSGVSAEAIVGYLGWKAGLLPEWRPAAAHELIGRFTVAALPAQPVVVEALTFLTQALNKKFC